MNIADSKKQKSSILKKDEILRPDLHKQISELLDQDYNISPDQVLVNVNKVTFEKIPKMDPPRAQKYPNYNGVVPLNVQRPRVTHYSDSQIQTDLSFKNIKVKGQMDAVYSEVEVLGFTYMTEEERQEQLSILLNDDCPIEKYSYDPCTEFTSFSRYNDPSIPVPRSRSISSHRKQVPIATTRSIGSQTLYTSNSIHRSTQTIDDYSSAESSPLHQLLIAKTKATIKSDPDGSNKIKERFTIQNKKDYSIGYTQTSEYDNHLDKQELVKSSLRVDKIDEDKETDKEANEDLDKKKLVKSTMEMTSVINNKTTVTGISAKDAPEKFTIQIINPETGNEEYRTVPKYLIENLELDSNSSSPKFDRKLVEDIYNHSDIKLAQKPFNIRCDDENVVKEEDLGFNSESNNSSVRFPYSKNLSPRSILQSSPDLSKNTKEIGEYSIRQLPKFSPGDLRKNHSEKNIPNNPELNDSFTQLEENLVKLNSAAFKASSPKIQPKSRTNFGHIADKQYENNLIKKNPALFRDPPTREMTSNLKKNNFIDQKNSGLDQIPTNLKINAPKGEAVANFKKSLMQNSNKLNEQLPQMSEYSIKQIPALFKIDQPNKEPKSSLKKNLNEKNIPNNPELNDSYRFSVDKVPKMFRYEAKDPVPVSSSTKLDLPDTLKKKLSQNDMVLAQDQNVSPKSIIKQRNTSQDSYTQKQMRKVDFNENMVDIDFEAYERPRIRQKVIEIEEPLSANESEHIERASFRTDSTNSSRPEVKERKRVPPSNDIILEKFANQTQPSANFKQKLLSKNQINNELNVDDDVMAEPELNFIQNLPTQSTNVNCEHKNTENSMNIEDQRPQFLVFSQSPNKKCSIGASNLSKSVENINICDNAEIHSLGFSQPKNEVKIEKFDEEEKSAINDLELDDSPKTKMEKLIFENIHREYKKALKRDEHRKNRLPEIMKLFDKANEKEMKHLEEELKLLMRKSKTDKELIQNYQFKFDKKLSLSSENICDNEEITDLESTSLVSFNKNYVKNKLVKKRIQKEKFRSSNKTLESGYSSLEDSLNDLKAKDNIDVMPSNNQIVAMVDRSETNVPIKPRVTFKDEDKQDLNSAGYKARRVAGSQENSASGSNHSVASNPNTSNNSVFTSNPNSATSSIRQTGGEGGDGGDDSGDEDERRKKKNIHDNRRNVNKKEPNKPKVKYVEENDLKEIDMNQFIVENDPETGEPILVNKDSNENFIILAQNWRESPNSAYIAEQDLDLNNMNFYFDEIRGRKYVIDEENNKIYYIVDSDSIKKLAPLAEKVQDSNQVIRMKHEDEPEQTIEIDYVEESELSLTNLDDFASYRDEDSGEIILVCRADTKKRWVILPNNWRNTNTPYIDQEDIDSIQIDVYQDTKTSRKYVIVDQSGQRFYIVPKFRNDIRNYASTKPSQINQDAAEPKVDQEKDGPDKGDKRKPNPASLVIGSEKIQNLDNEPSNSKLRESEAKSPSRHIRFDPNLPTRKTQPDANKPKNVIIKQPGKPGHLIRKDGDSRAKSPKPQKKTEKQIKIEQAKKFAQDKIKQEAARRVFFQQKLPDVGKLWMHQLLINRTNKEKQMDNLIKAYNSNANLNDEIDYDPNRKPWRSLNELNDPTLNKNGSSDESLDRKRLAEVQIYGYNKFDKSKKKRNFLEEDDSKFRKGKDYQQVQDANNNSFGGFENYPFIRGVLTEDFVESKEYRPVQMNSKYRALVPNTKLNLRQQFLTSPQYLKPTWDKILDKSEGMKPKIILINDDELILTKNRECNVYVQYDYPNDAVRGANPAYQLMLPDRGPTGPARPLMISPAKLSKQIERKLPVKPEFALMDAPVYVYHQNGSSFYENLAQYLAGKHPQLSPKTARKILKFADLKEFEEYLAAKLSREEAKRLAKFSGEEIIDVDSVNENLKITRDKNKTNGETLYHHFNCEYDPLRPPETGKFDTETHEYQIGGTKMKSTFIGFDKNGDQKKVKFEELPKNLLDIVKEANINDSNVKS